MEEILLHIYHGDFFNEVDVGKFNKEAISIGSDESDDIFIQSEFLYPSSVIFENRLGAWVILNPASRGVFYGEKLIDRKTVENGDVFTVSKSVHSGEDIRIVVLDKACYPNKSSKYLIKDLIDIKIGSASDNDIVYGNSFVHNRHCVIRCMRDREYCIESCEGHIVHINGTRAERKSLSPGDTIYIGGHKIVFDRTWITVFHSDTLISVKNLKEVLSIESIYPYFQRSPRLEPQMPIEEVSIPSAPQKPNKPNTGLSFWLQLFLTPMVTCLAAFAYPRSLMFTVPMASATVIISLSNFFSQTKEYKKRDRLRNEKYSSAIMKIDYKLENMRAEQKSILLRTHPEPEECVQIAEERSRRLWERATDDNDFIDVRVGIGDVPLMAKIKYSVPEINIDDDPLLDKPQVIFEKHAIVEKLPITVNLYEACTVGVIGIRSNVIAMIRNILIRLAVHHSYDEVKFVLIFPQEELHEWSWVRWLPHVWDENYKNRFVACEASSAHDIMNMFNDLLKKRESDLEEKKDEQQRLIPHYIFILADKAATENEPVVKLLMKNNSLLGVSTILAFDKMQYLPKNCRYILELVSEATGLIYEKKKSSHRINFTPDKISAAKSEFVARRLAPVRLKQVGAEQEIPVSVPFLELFGVDSTEKLNIKTRWEGSETFKSLAVPLGLREGGDKLLLDLHEKYHGPHGLIAGTTGSGKSELLQSLILSLAVNFHPHDVAFVIIDYKGGGMANLFEDLPHLIGTITNLDGNQITRSLVSIKSEIKRRQEVLGEYKVNHIDGYQMLYKKKEAQNPLPHLIIIIDEFAELKSEQPEFMRELVSAARVGRSLGIHLILATQKPSGVVDDQIWSNARFRLCLKVQGREDSNEVLKRPDAGDIKHPGRAYLQVGNNEIFDLFQSAWSGAKYNPGSEGAGTGERLLLRVGLEGSRRPLFSYEKSKGTGNLETQLNAVIKQIMKTASEQDIERLNGPWLPPLSDVIWLWELLGMEPDKWDGCTWRDAKDWICPVIGFADSPSEQKQYPAFLDLGKEGHAVLYGAPGTGKTTFLSTVITSLAITYSPKDVNIYIMDFGGRTFNTFGCLPHVGDVVIGEDEEKLSKLVKLLKKEIDKRKKIFSDIGVTNLSSFRAVSENKLPAIVLIVDNYSAMSELYPYMEEVFVQLSREAANYGLHLVVTASAMSELKYKVSQNFKISVALQMTDKSDYVNIVGRTSGLEPSPVNGRGLIKMGKPVEFQTALPFPGKNEAERSQEMRKCFERVSGNWEGKRAKKIPVIPEVMSYREMLEYEEIKESICGRNLIPLGLTTEDMEPVFFDFGDSSSILVAGQIQSGRTTVLKCLLTTVLEKDAEGLYQVNIIDSNNMGLYKYKSINKIASYSSDAADVSAVVSEIILKIENRKEQLLNKRMDSGGEFDEKSYIDSVPRIIVFIDEYKDFMDMADDDTKMNLEKLVKRYKGLGLCIVISGLDDDISSNSYDSFTKAVIDNQTGLLTGGSFEQQRVFSTKMPYSEQGNILGTGEAYYISKGRYVKLKLPLI
ncbi:S-DNA-T family DNA segregation ATPase FtsK/SpoIIIE [Anaerobacterium chartisolvens]|uniref:S-DNA-T family DNA segregation ATPase FtsK/SpoIIIE n=1 Tax=Anaerobacterium chartisolvens TaxID=1297424 RepID=A0A369AVB4_9FIRM|nr:type VII secretion protein EssC [Anaerobacterium chartisolvens]RCX13013.1 S-DNA-T family DNA segregation ATPase FtsK/SpoIIIE [Anaerobacterium chartisolvens]